MKRKPLALVWATREEAGSRSSPISIHQRLLGRSILGLAIQAVQGLHPGQILTVLADDETGGAEARSHLVELPFLRIPKTRGALGAIISARDVLVRNQAKDLVFLNARLALLSPGSLRSLLSVHRRCGNALTSAVSLGQLPVQAVRIRDLLKALDGLSPRERARGRIDGLIDRIAKNGGRIGSCRLRHPEESLTVRTPADVSAAIMFLRERKISELESRRVIVLDPATTWVDRDVRVGPGTVIYPSVVIEGLTKVGIQCRIYPFVHLIDARLGDRVKVLSSTVIEKSRIERDAQVGPFARFRPMSVVRPGAKVGNFVEMKNTVFGERSKAGHLSYLGDAVVGEGVNIGAGTITCNYDGFRKSQTRIEKGAFIGSGTELVAPLRIGRNAYIGAGSVITKDVAAEALAVARGRQVQRPGWVKRRRKK
jgi:bifunctional UDP-N-acetylglucosamine pyrophosphorylase/glucosamine-1-phosphate N-acetyltransferase